MDDLTAVNFYKHFSQNLFQNHHEAITFLDRYQPLDLLETIPLQVANYYATQQLHIHQNNQYYQDHSRVIDAIHAVYNMPDHASSNLYPINLSDGAGSFECFPMIQAQLQHFFAVAQYHYYPNPNLPERIITDLNRWAHKRGFKLENSNQQLLNWHFYSGGVTRACAEAFKLMGKQDMILVPTPTYGNLISLAATHANVTLMPLCHRTHWKLTPAILAQYLKQDTQQLLVFVNPTNPTGAIYTQQEVNALAEIIMQFPCMVLDDIVHNGLEFATQPAPGVFQASPASQRTITVFGPSKTHCAAGWRLGIIHVSNPQYAAKIKHNSLLSDYSTNKLYEVVINACYGEQHDQQHYLAQHNLEYHLRHELLKLYLMGESAANQLEHGGALINYIKTMFPHKAVAFLAPAPGLALLTAPQASFFQLLSFYGWKNKRLGNFQIKSSFDVYHMLKALNLATLPDLAQGYQDHEQLAVRISISNSDLPDIKLQNSPAHAKNIIAHYLLGCAIERIKALTKLLN